ncbi:MAG: MarR family transcriptional regulator [Clostridia bacterium]|nr:MarR family transcriptional regulator [Clostridia bacterium]
MEHMNREQMSLPRLFRETEGLMHRYVASLTPAAFDPERGQGRILALLRKTGPISQRDMAYLLGIRPQSLGELVRKLEENEYICREQSAEDKRGYMVSLTDKGSEVELPKPPMERVFSCLDESEQDSLRHCLERLCSQLEELTPDRPPQDGPGWGGPGGGFGPGPHHGCHPRHAAGHGHGCRPRRDPGRCGFGLRGELFMTDPGWGGF